MRYVSPIWLFLTFVMKKALKLMAEKHGDQQFDGIMIADTRRITPGFSPAVLSALLLIREVDPRRYARVRRHLRWIINSPLVEASAVYRHGVGCLMYFREPRLPAQRSYCVASCATTLIHEATHGRIRTCGIRYTRARRDRIEKLCVTEEQRFIGAVARARPDLTKYFEYLNREFNESPWHAYWNMSRSRRAVLIRRLKRSEEKLRRAQDEK